MRKAQCEKGRVSGAESLKQEAGEPTGYPLLPPRICHPELLEVYLG